MRGNMFNGIAFSEKETEILSETEKTPETDKDIWDIITKKEADNIPEAEKRPDAEEVFAEFGFSEKKFTGQNAAFYEQSLPGQGFAEEVQADVSEFKDYKKAYMDKDLYHREGISRVGPGGYAFALGYLRDPRTMEIFEKTPYPGYFAGIKRSDGGYMEAIKEGNAKAAKRLICECIKLDCEKLEKEFFEVGSNDHNLKKGETLLAIAAAPGIKDVYGDYIWPGADYHIYRKGDAGQWYYKPGMLPPRRLDNMFKPIEDPENSSRGDYSMFLGYYVVRDKKPETI